MTTAPPLAIIGFGNMGSAILKGIIAAGITSRDGVTIADPDTAKCAGLAAAFPTPFGALKALHELERTHGPGQILMAVKPQMLSAAMEGLAPLIGDRVVISILAGTPSQKVRELTGGHSRVIRAMPNLPAAVGQATTAIAVGAGATHDDAAFAMKLFTAIGPVVVETDEADMDAFTAVAGSGPAYLFYLAEAMINAATAMGFSHGDAVKSVRQTLVGAAAMLSHNAKTPAELRAAVTSKGGTTAAAMGVLDGQHVRETIEKAMHAAKARGEELAKV
jgi:pyrroline-5-carboxylate reductase